MVSLQTGYRQVLRVGYEIFHDLRAHRTAVDIIAQGDDPKPSSVGVRSDRFNREGQQIKATVNVADGVGEGGHVRLTPVATESSALMGATPQAGEMAAEWQALSP